MKRKVGDALDRAISIIGGQRQTARALGIAESSISDWKRCPKKRVLALEKLSGVRRGELRPDLCGAFYTENGLCLEQQKKEVE